MAIVFHNKKFNKITIDSNKIIGLVGNNYERIFQSIKGKNNYYIGKEFSFITKNVNDELKNIISDDEIINTILKEFSLDESFLKRDISSLSDSDKKILQYLILFLHNPSILLIDEPFLYLDYEKKKQIINLLKSIIKNTKKTIIIGSNDSNIIYSLCQKVLFINDVDYCYGNVDLFHDNELLDKYNIDMPMIVEFVHLAHNKGINIPYSKDIRDLIKDVYKNV